MNSFEELVEFLNRRTPTIDELVDKHKVSKAYLEKQLKAGIKVEKEHTTSEYEAREIALDHLNEKPNYYVLLKQVED